MGFGVEYPERQITASQVSVLVLKRRTLGRIAFIWIVLLVAASLQPARPGGFHYDTPRHSMAHVLIFAATAVIVLSLSRTAHGMWAGAAGLVALATAIEIAQFLVYALDRFEWWDVREDAIGLLFGIALLRFTRVRSLLLAGA